MIFVRIPAQVSGILTLGQRARQRTRAQSYFVSSELAHAVRIATAASMRAEMITFFMRNGFISETTVLQNQGLNQIGILLFFQHHGMLIGREESVR